MDKKLAQSHTANPQGIFVSRSRWAVLPSTLLLLRSQGPGLWLPEPAALDSSPPADQASGFFACKGNAGPQWEPLHLAPPWGLVENQPRALSPPQDLHDAPGVSQKC